VQREVTSLYGDPIDFNAEDLGLEISLCWMELLKDYLLKTRNPKPLLDSLRALIKEPLLWLTLENGKAVVISSDFEVPTDVLKELCTPSGFYGKLATIRFTHYYSERSDCLREIVEAGHPPVRRWVAVPICEDGEVVGCLSAAGRRYAAFDHRHGMLLSLAAMILSILGKDAVSSIKGNSRTQGASEAPRYDCGC
jgi:hypothetical protein